MRALTDQRLKTFERIQRTDPGHFPNSCVDELLVEVRRLRRIEAELIVTKKTDPGGILGDFASRVLRPPSEESVGGRSDGEA